MPDPLLLVMSEKCRTCVFGPDSVIGPLRFAELRKSWEARGNEHFQVCHYSATADVDDEDEMAEVREHGVVCRGFYDEMYVRRGVAVATIQIAERLGVLGFTDVHAYEERMDG